MNDMSSTRSTASLFSDVLGHMSSLMRKEFDLARTEISENINRAAIAVGLIIGAIVIALTSLNVLAAALVAAIAELGLEPGWASLIVGLGFAAIAFGMMAKGLNDLKFTSLAPTRTAKNVQRDAEAVKETL